MHPRGINAICWIWDQEFMKEIKKKKVTWKDLAKYLKKHDISEDDAIILLKAEAIKDNFIAINMHKQIEKFNLKLNKKKASSSKLQASSLTTNPTYDRIQIERKNKYEYKK